MAPTTACPPMSASAHGVLFSCSSGGRLEGDMWPALNFPADSLEISRPSVKSTKTALDLQLPGFRPHSTPAHAEHEIVKSNRTLAGGALMIPVVAPRRLQIRRRGPDLSLPLQHGPVVLQRQPVAAGATPVAKVGVGRPALAAARVIALPARGLACPSDIQTKPQVEWVLFAWPEPRLFTLFVWLFVFWLFL